MRRKEERQMGPGRSELFVYFAEFTIKKPR